MCLTLALELGSEGGVLATDTRRTFSKANGEPVVSDLGGKLRRTPGGLVAATGDARVGFAGLDHLEDVDARNRDALRKTVTSVYQKVGPTVRARYDDGQPEAEVRSYE